MDPVSADMVRTWQIPLRAGGTRAAEIILPIG
jgi:hypothetical protein